MLSCREEPDLHLVSSHTPIQKVEQKTEAFEGSGERIVHTYYKFRKKFQNKLTLEHLIHAFYLFVLCQVSKSNNCTGVMKSKSTEAYNTLIVKLLEVFPATFHYFHLIMHDY